jgi:NADPH:quinone reductase-like Zn-dependent oxidoreductase
VLAAGTGFTDTLYPARPLDPACRPSSPDSWLLIPVSVGAYAQYAIRNARFLVPVPDGDPAEAVCIPLASLTAHQMLTRYGRIPRGATTLVIGASAWSSVPTTGTRPSVRL